jgi:beta-galactosidase
MTETERKALEDHIKKWEKEDIMSQRIYLNDDWKFTEQFSEDLLARDCEEQGLTPVRLPHTCKEIPFHYFDEHMYQMVSGYRKILKPCEEWKGKTVLLTVDGAAHDSQVFLNGEEIGSHHCGYTAFTMDISDKLLYGEDNVLVVKVDSNETLNVPPFGFVVDYLTYGGIYRDVYLDIKNETYIEDGFVRCNISEEDIHSVMISEIKREESADAVLLVDVAVREKQAGQKTGNTDLTWRVSLKEKGEDTYYLLGEQPLSGYSGKAKYEVKNAKLWDTANPVLYEVKLELVKGEQTVDEKVITTGFRRAEFKTDGFYLNGRKLKIRGLNRHQSYPYVGYAMPESMQKMDADILKNELGVNAVRTSHYPQSHYFLQRCDEIGLLVFTEMPGWQHIGDEQWKLQAIENVKDMVLQYRNHTSIILWGVRINESVDDDAFYKRTNEVAHQLDDSRPTGGVRAYKKSNLLEDVYTYNDFLHDGKRKGCDRKKDVTSDNSKPYLVSEYNGHMYPTKPFDWEEHRVEHAMRHANVLDEVAHQEDIAGSFGWCMFDYNTHKDFGSGDRICYHGVMDMFRNPKLAADIYTCQQEDTPVLSLSSTMDIGEHPGCNRGETYIFTNADSVKMYKNNRFLKEYRNSDSPYKYLKHGPIAVDDYIGNAIAEQEDFSPKKIQLVKDILNETAKVGLYGLSTKIYLKAARLMAFHGMKMTDAVELYNRYIGDWGGAATTYRLEAFKDGKMVKSLDIQPMKQVEIQAKVSHGTLVEKNSYDVAAVRFQAVDERGNQLYYYNEPVMLSVEGPITIVGPEVVSLQGGMGGTYIKTTGEAGKAKLVIRSNQTKEKILEFNVEVC